MQRIRLLLVTYLIIILCSCVSGTTARERDSYQGSLEELYSSLPKAYIDKPKLKAFIAEGVEFPIDLEGIKPNNLIKSVSSYIGVPYVIGGNSRRGIDCAALTQNAFRDLGVNIPRTAEGQARHGVLITNKADLRRGDLVFFTRTYKTSKFLTHVGVYIGDSKFINANSYYGKVTVDVIDDKYWKQYYLFGVRYFD